MIRFPNRFTAVVAIAMTAGTISTPVAAAEDELALPLAYLGLSAAEGKTEADASAGKTEIDQLTTALMGKAAVKVWTNLEAANGKVILPIAGTSQVDLKPYYFVRMRLEGIERAYEATRPITCKAPGDGKGTKGARGLVDGAESAGLDTSASALLQTGFALLKNDTKLTGIQAAISDDLLLNAIAGGKPASNTAQVLFAQDIQSPGTGTVSALWERHLRLINAVNQLAKAGCEKDPVNGALFAYMKGQVEEIAKGEKDKPSLLEQGMLLESVAEKEPLILRLKLENTNGTMISVKNVWTTLGAEALRFRAGLSLSYRLTNPKDGSVLASGTVRCAWKPVGFRSIDAAATDIAGSDPCT